MSGPLGVGFLVDELHAVTCAHVVAAALGLDRDETAEGARLYVDLPLSAGSGGRAATVTADVVRWGPAPDGGGLDIAVLRLDSPVPGSGPARFVDVEPERLRGHATQIIGFPEGRGQGVWHEGVLRGAQADGQIQVDQVGAGYRVSRGFSGSPVWSPALGAVVGMTVKAELGDPASGFMIPVSQLIATWAPLAALARPVSPFRSLEPFEEAHATAFFGRRADSERLARVVGEQRWTTLVGPSGCGKSSLAMAGVAPRRRAERDVVAILRPAHHSGALRGLAAVLLDLLEPDGAEADKFARVSAVADEIAGHGLRGIVASVLRVQRVARLLIVVDQFEELLDEELFASRDIDALADALGGVPPAGPGESASRPRSPGPPSTLSVLAVLRADFLGPVLAHPRLGLLARKHVEALEPMREEQLRDVVARPLDAIPAVTYEDALVNRILADAGNAPGILPLLSFTLAQLWDNQRGGRLTHDAYDALGGVGGALGSYADTVWQRYVGDERDGDGEGGEQDGDGDGDGAGGERDRDDAYAERLLTRLVRTPVGTDAPVRRIVVRAELTDREWRLAQRLAGARLLVVNRGRVHTGSPPEGPESEGPALSETVELAHEALISSWDRLGSRVRDDRVFLDWRENLQLDMDRWERAGRTRDLLPTATAQEAAERWLPERSGELGDAQREYVRLGRAHRRYLTRRRRTVTALFGVLLLAVSIAAGVAIDQRQTVARQRDRATSAQVAGLAQSMGRTDPQLARRLAVAGARLGDTPEAWSALLAVRNQVEKRAVKLPAFDVTTSALDEAGRVLVAAGGTQVGTWDVDTGERLGSYRTAERVRNVRVSGDGTTVAVSTDDETTVVMEARGLRPRGRPYPTGPAVFSLSPEGTFLAASVRGKKDGYVATVWNTRTAKALLRRTGSMPFDTSFTADEGRLALTSASKTGATVIWVDLRTGKNLPVPDFGIEPEDFPGAMAFSPDGRRTAVLTEKALRVSEVFDDGETGSYDFRKIPRDNSDPGLYGEDVSFSHDGRFVAAGFSLWDATFTEGVDPVFSYPTDLSHCDPGTFQFSADDSELRCVGSDGTFRSVDVSRVTSRGGQPSAAGSEVVASEDGSTLAVGGSDAGTVEIWSTAPLARRTELRVAQAGRMLLSPDGRLLAVADGPDTVEIWDTVKRTRRGTLPGALGGLTTTVALSPDGTTYATYDGAGNAGSKGYVHSLRFYDLRTMKLIRKSTFTLRTALIDFSTTVTFRPDGEAVTVSPLLGTVAVPSGKVLVPGGAGLRLDGYSPDGTSAYTDPDSVHSSLTFIDPKTLRPRGEPLDIGAPPLYEAPTLHSPDGRLIAVAQEGPTGGDDAEAAGVTEITLWDLRTRRRIGTLSGATGSLVPRSFTADGSALVTQDDQGAFRPYAVAPSRLVGELCALSDGGLTEKEWREHIPDVPYRETC
ncbi:trypsin-like peptidase domain-containing protein [Streptomyces sp. NPDC006645]|uniref:nSTAND1 domain-containing NTPase n=1 Tax=unclassified Streptomyces TaxID=2593676 RepID=UPI0033A41534